MRSISTPAMKETINQVEKRIRAAVIREYMERNGIATAVCFSCGNASRALRDAGVRVLDISPSGDLEARRWFTQEEIRRYWPASFDATSGHLPADLMLEIAARLRQRYEDEFTPGHAYNIETGSGETVLCLAVAFPECVFIPVYNDLCPATQREPGAPLGPFIRAFFKTVNKLKAIDANNN